MTQTPDSSNMAAAAVSRTLNWIGIAGIVLLVLKITDSIDWPWWAVTLPSIIVVSAYTTLLIIWVALHSYNKGRGTAR